MYGGEHLPDPAPFLTLRPADLDGLHKLRITDAIIKAAGIRRVTDAEARKDFGIAGSPTRDYAGIVFPYHAIETGKRSTARLRRDNPELENGAPKDKYINGFGDRRRLYFPPGAKQRLDDAETVVVLVEAEKSSLAVAGYAERTNRKMVAFGLGGCWGWRGRIGRTRNVNGVSVEKTGPLPDLEHCSGRIVIVLLDANVTANSAVQHAERSLVAVLRNLRCEVKVCRLPQPSDASDEAWNGPDDYIGLAGDEAFTAVIDTPLDTAGVAGDFSDNALALAFAARFGADLRYTADWNRWTLWTDTHWQDDHTLAVSEQIQRFCQEEATRCGRVGLAMRIQSRTTTAAVEWMARSKRQFAATVEQWNADAMLFGTAAGTLDLRTGELRTAEREDYITKASPYSPANTADCPLWMSFLQRIFNGDAELIHYMHKVIGYTMTGRTVEQQLWFLYGTGANGKSVFLNTLCAIFGSYARVAAIETFVAAGNGAQHPADLAFLCNSRLAIATEVDKGRHWSEAKLKGIVAGDTVTCRFMHCNFFSYVPSYKVLIAGNNRPELRTVNEAARRRMRFVPFNVTIPPQERDIHLGAKLLTEGSAILRWCADGCRRYLEEGLVPPEAVDQATTEYLSSEDAIARWLEERTEKAPQKETLSSRLFQDWQQWTESNGEHAGKHKAFAQSLSQHECVSRHTEFGTAWKGLKLKVLPNENDVNGY